MTGNFDMQLRVHKDAGRNNNINFFVLYRMVWDYKVSWYNTVFFFLRVSFEFLDNIKSVPKGPALRVYTYIVEIYLPTWNVIKWALTSGYCGGWRNVCTLHRWNKRTTETLLIATCELLI